MTTQDRRLPWRCRGTELDLSNRTWVMGILNVTPDSFSDGGQFMDFTAAVEHALEMIRQGADIIDIGGESTRPGANPVSVEEEVARVVPVIRAIHEKADCLISIDTQKAEVAEKAIEAGAVIVNDVSACTADSSMANVIRETGVGVVLMHMRGTPRTMQTAPEYTDVLEEVTTYLEGRMADLREMGIAPECMALDPGIGFGKTVEHNCKLLAGLGRLVKTGRPVLIGLSRKSFLGKLTGADVDARLPASIAGAVYAAIHGAHIIRVHDVKETCEATRLVDILKREEVDYVIV